LFDPEFLQYNERKDPNDRHADVVMKRRKYSIPEIAQIVAPVAKVHGVRKIALFGSYARGEATESSDIDFHLIDKGEICGLFQLAGFQIALEEALATPVDVVTTGSCYKDVLRHVEREEILIYEA
jgi:predicted nucleotidyltransferase